VINSYESVCPYCGGSGNPHYPNLDMNAEPGCPFCKGSGFSFKPFQRVELPDYEPLNKQEGGAI
jgi:DnaJ-class molecular chaperone